MMAVLPPAGSSVLALQKAKLVGVKIVPGWKCVKSVSGVTLAPAGLALITTKTLQLGSSPVNISGE